MSPSIHIRPRALLIAASDPSGGAGLEADQRVLALHGVYAMTTTTALTEQDTSGVFGQVQIVEPAFVGRCLSRVWADLGRWAVPRGGDGGEGGEREAVVKIGMLASAETIQVVAETLKECAVKTIVLDPVMVSTSGHNLLPQDAREKLRTLLVPMTTLLTPNIPEAVSLLEGAGQSAESPRSLDQLKALAQQLHGLGPKAVLLKGGHVPMTRDYAIAESKDDASLIVDILFDGSEYTVIEAAYSSSKNTHGTGCSLASAIAANLALGQDMTVAVRSGCRYVEEGIKTSSDMGSGNGPINHFHSAYHLPFAPGRFIEYLLDRKDIREPWRRYTQHEFVQQMAKGTLPTEQFKDYLIQDYLYLTHFARSNALAAYKSTSMDSIASSAEIVLHIKREMSLHLDYCSQFGLSKTDIERHEESQACVAYSRYVLDIGQSQDWLALQMALAPCLLGYGEAAARLYHSSESVPEGNAYWKWFDNYVAADYVDAVRKGSDLIETSIRHQSPTRIEQLVDIFRRATEMEIQFWDFGAHASNLRSLNTN